MKEGTVAVRDASARSTLLVSSIVFGLSVVITVAFAYLMFADPARLTDAWLAVRSLPLAVQLVMWALLLPWMIALWVWSLPLALGVRIAVVAVLLIGSNCLLVPGKK
jgi:hypothetical protein